MTFEPTGAIVAAPTCRLPGRHRRRAQLGLPLHLDPRQRHSPCTRSSASASAEEADAVHALASPNAVAESDPDGSLQIVYGIDGRTTLTEEVLDHLAGYRGSRPVRIGNGAYDQLQLDIYGELMDSRRTSTTSTARPISYDLWLSLRACSIGSATTGS